MEIIVNEVTDGKSAISFWKKPWIDQFNRTQTLAHLFFVSVCQTHLDYLCDRVLTPNALFSLNVCVFCYGKGLMAPDRVSLP